MNKLNYILIIGVSLGLLSCKDSFLERHPTGQVSRDQLLNTVDGIRNALTGTYTRMAAYHTGNYGIYGDLRGDDVELIKTASNAVMVTEYDYNSNQDEYLGAVGGLWSGILEALNNVNNVITAVEELQGSENQNKLDSLYGQALVLRAMCHFDLAQIYSQHYTYTADASHLGVPVLLRTPAPGTPVARNTMKETYAQILKDLADAMVYLQNNNPNVKTKATSYAAQALRSRIYLYMENWEGVVMDANSLLNTGKFPLTSKEDYINMFIDPSQRSATGIYPEVIWQFNRNSGGNGDINKVFSDKEEFVVAAKDTYLGLFEPEDTRFNMFAYNSNKDKYYSLKYGLDPSIAAALWPINYKVIRSAELYLNRAEAHWHLKNYEGAVEDLKAIRARAYGKLIDEVSVSYTDVDDLLSQILLERRKELGFENQRIYDIVRNKKDLDRGDDCNSAVCKITYPSNLFVLPIPSLELDANPAMQPNPEVNN